MKKININNPKKQRAKRNILFSALILFVCVLMIYNAFANNKKLTEENFTKVEGVVTSFQIVEEENGYQFGIKDNNNATFIIFVKQETNTNLPKISDNVKIGDEIILVCNEIIEENGEEKQKTYNAYKVTINDKLLYNRIEDAIKSNNKLIIFYAIVSALFIAYLVYCIISFVKMPTLKEVTFVEYTITNNNAVTNLMLKNDSKTMQLLKKEKLLNKCIFIFMVIILFVSILVKSLITNKLILLIVSVVLVAGLIVLMVLFRPRFYSKNLNIYIDDYLDYLKTGTLKEDRTLILTKEGIKVLIDEQTYFFTYEDLNLFTVGVYSKTNAPVNIFICSALQEKEEFKDFEDFIIPLSVDIYKDILDNNIEISGLEQLINNLYEETCNNIKDIKEGFLFKYYH